MLKIDYLYKCMEAGSLILQYEFYNKNQLYCLYTPKIQYYQLDIKQKCFMNLQSALLLQNW